MTVVCITESMPVNPREYRIPARVDLIAKRASSIRVGIESIG